MSEFDRGFYCALAMYLKENGHDRGIESLFSCNGGASNAVNADKEDQEIFIQYGLMEGKS